MNEKDGKEGNELIHFISTGIMEPPAHSLAELAQNSKSFSFIQIMRKLPLFVLVTRVRIAFGLRLFIIFIFWLLII